MELRKLDEEFEDVSVGAGEESSPHGGTPPRKMRFGTAALPELIVKYAPAVAVFIFSALTSGAPFVLDTYPFGIAALCAARLSAAPPSWRVSICMSFCPSPDCRSDCAMAGFLRNFSMS